MFKNRKKTKLISLMLVMCLIFSSIFSITVFSADVDYDLSTAYVDEFSYEAGAAYDQEVYDYIKQEMLKNTNLTVAEIADEVGFSDYNHFSRLFKKYNGCSAREYRIRYQ